MKKIPQLLFLLALSVKLYGQPLKEFTLYGTISGLKDGTIEIIDDYNNDPNLKADKKDVPVVNGSFKFTGRMAYPFSVYLIYHSGEKKLYSQEFFIDFGTQKFTADSVSLKDEYTLSGSAANDEYLKEYKLRFTDIEDRLNNWYTIYDQDKERLKKDTNAILEDSLQNVRKSIRNTYDSIFYAYALSHRTSYIVLWELSHLFYYRYSPYYEKAFYALNGSVRKSHMGDVVLKAITSSKQTTIGGSLPAVSVLDSAFNAVNVGFSPKKQNKYLFIDIWYSRCGPCLSKLPGLREAYNKFKNKGFEMVSISEIEPFGREDWMKAVHQQQLEWPQYFDKKQLFIYQLYTTQFPSSFLIDDQGKIIARDLEPDQLNAFLTAHLN